MHNDRVTFGDRCARQLVHPIGDRARRGQGRRIFDPRRERFRRFRSTLPIGMERFTDHRLQRGRDIASELSERWNVALTHRLHRLPRGLSVKQSPSGERTPQHDPSCKHVGASIHTRAFELLGSHIAELSGQNAVVGFTQLRCFGNAEVHDSRDAIDAHKHILRGDVAVYDSERITAAVARFVCRVQPAEHGAANVRGDRDGNKRTAAAQRIQQRRQRRPAHVFHDDHDFAVFVHDVEDGDNVGMLYARSEPSLFDEHGVGSRVASQSGEHSLDGNHAAEAMRTDHLPVVDRRHAARGYHRVQRVTPCATRRLARSRSFRRHSHSARILPSRHEIIYTGLKLSRLCLVKQLLTPLALLALMLACSYDYAAAVRCANGVRDDDEADVDCGGSCVAASQGVCGYGKSCSLSSDCDQDVARCQLGRCTPNKLAAWWRKISTPSKMEPRFGARLTFYGTAGVLIGGYQKLNIDNPPPATSLQDSWIFFERQWAREQMDAPGRYYHAQAFDSVLHQVVIAGGQSTLKGRLSDAWARDANNQWTRLSDLPDSRVGAAMVYDENHQQLIVYGEGAGDEVWVRASEPDAQWKILQTIDAPPVPFWHAMAYDAARGKVVVFGGTDISYEPNQRTSILDPSTLTWQKLEFSDGPRARWGAAMAYDPRRQRMVLFGGRAGVGLTSDATNDTWLWDGEAWSKLDRIQGDSALPRESFLAAFDYDPEGRQMIMLLGGLGGFNALDPAETWTLAVLGWPCSSNQDCGESTFCVDTLCCNSACEGGVCNDRDRPGVCSTKP